VAGIGLASLLAALGAVAAHGQQAAQGASDPFNIPDNVTILGPTDLGSRKATAIVNGALITGTDVDHRVALILAANDETNVPAEELQRLRLQVLRALIDETLQIQEAAALEIEVTQDQVDQEYERVARQEFERSPEEMDKHLLSVGSSAQSLKRQLQGALAWRNLLQRNVGPFVNVSTSEANELYQRMQASRGEPEYRVGEIFLEATPATRDAVAANVQRIFEQLREGASFVAFARQYSDASTAAVGGDLGWIRLEQLQNPQLEAVARDMQPGQMVGPVEIPGGFSILYMIDKRQVGMADPRDAVLSLKQISLDFAAGTSEAQAREKAAGFQQMVQQIRGCGEADETAAKIGAQVVTNDQMRVRDLPEALQTTLLQLNIGQATPPFGSLQEGVRVLMLCGRDDPQVTGGPDAEQLMAQLRDDRINKRAQSYLRDLRRDAVIEYN
jgi:peptidyl-prolyl cis-trans isomerase SurA